MAKKKIKNKRKQLAKPDVITNISNEVLAAAYSVTSQTVIPVLLKVCRLCESKDGPFLNIFDAEKVTAKKIDELMPFSVLENDDLPHKICFRCSAKLEELYEFIQRCIKTQESLRNAVGKSGPFITKSKMAKKAWEEKLNKNNMSNDDICDALIKKAMAGIQGITVEENNTLPVEETNSTSTLDNSTIETKRTLRSKELQLSNLEIKPQQQSDDADEVSLKQVKMTLERDDLKPLKNKNKKANKIDNKTENETTEATQQRKTDVTSYVKFQTSQTTNDLNEKKSIQQKTSNPENSLSFNNKESLLQMKSEKNPVKESQNSMNAQETKPFNIMDHISMIKVNGVGVLFQCKLCNRNFLKKEVVESHNCAKNGLNCINKLDVPKAIPPPEPPKAPTVKYIKIDSDRKKSLTEKIKSADKNTSDSKTLETITVQDDSNDASKLKPKPKAGPASKTRRNETNLDNGSANQNRALPLGSDSPSTSSLPSVQFTAMPNLNSRFKLCPGPNNVFTLVEDSSTAPLEPPPSSDKNDLKKYSRKRKSNDDSVTNKSINQSITNSSELKSNNPTIPEKTDSFDVIDLEDTAKPYPVGLFQTIAHSARLYESTASKDPPTFTTPAMKKQSYTVVQTGNPSKLLISAKSVEEEVPKKRQRKTKLEKEKNVESKEPFTVTLEDRTLSVGDSNLVSQKESNFFTFINVDPLLQPSYVLPTDNTIQESQISTSSSAVSQPTQNKNNKDKEKYTCNICNETFSREKKMLAHIQSHYKKMDEEDQKWVEKVSKKKGKK